MKQLYVSTVWVDGGRLYAATTDGKIASYNLEDFKGFRNATRKQMENFEVINGNDIHWPELDEDINLEGMFYDNHLCALTPSEDSVVYRPMPESHDCVAEPLKEDL